MNKIAVAVALLAFFTPPAVAGTYVGVSLGKNQMGYSDVKASSAYTLLGGYFFSENTAAEVAYTSFGTAEMTSSTYKVTGTAMSFAAVGFSPLSQAVSLYGKLGVAMTKMEVADASFSESKAFLTYGLGVQYNVSNSVGLRLSYDSFKVGSTDAQNATLITIGAVLKF